MTGFLTGLVDGRAVHVGVRMRGVAAVGNLVLLTPAYTALQARISIVLQSVATFTTSPVRTHRGVIPARRRKSV